MIHRDCKEDIRREYIRLHAQAGLMKSTKKLALAKSYVHTLACLNTALIKAAVFGVSK